MIIKAKKWFIFRYFIKFLYLAVKIMDKRKENEILFGQKFSIILSQEMVQMVEREVELLNTVYKDISERLGLDIAVEIHRMYRGQQISFPIRLLNPTVIKQKVIQEYDGTNAKTNWDSKIFGSVGYCF